MALAELLAEDRRLIVLRALEQATGYSLNEHVLRTGLDAFGHRVGGDILRADLDWLEEHRLLAITRLDGPTGKLWIASLTNSGQDVAQGRRHVGVARPRAE